MKNHLAIIIPGLDYTAKQPLFHYAAQIATLHGYEVNELSFDHIPGYHANAGKDQLKALQQALTYCTETLSNIDYSAYDHVVLFSKDMGSLIAARLSDTIDWLSSHDNLTHISFAPILPAIPYMKSGRGIVFAGNADPFVPFADLRKQCAEKQLELHVLEGANHLLECTTMTETLRTLNRVMESVEQIVSKYCESIYSFTVKHPERGDVSLSSYEGQVLLIVNTATGCGFTPQYETLETLYRTYHDRGFTVLDFPCNQFGSQAPGSDAEIHRFCTARYDISYPQFSKIDVNGENEIPLYSFLKRRQKFHGFDLNKKEGAFLHKTLLALDPDYALSPDIKWNFTKFLVTRKGRVVARFEASDDLASLEEAVRTACL